MSRALLDINVLLAVLDSDHVDHDTAREWLDREIAAGWSSCAITQNGFVRIISQPRYPSPITPTEAIDLLGLACAEDYHEFWDCDLSVLNPKQFDRKRIHGPRQITDAYLLGLAVHHQGRFVTFDDAVPVSAVNGATAAHLVVLG